MPPTVGRLKNVQLCSFPYTSIEPCLFQKDKLREQEKFVFIEKCNKRLHKFLEYRLPVKRSDIGWESMHRAELIQALQTGVQGDHSVARCL